MVGSLLNGSQRTQPPDMHIFVLSLSDYQPDSLQQNTAMVMGSHTQDIFKDNVTFIYSLSCFSHFIFFQSLILSLCLFLLFYIYIGTCGSTSILEEVETGC